MHKFPNKLIAIGVLGVLAAIGSLMNSHPSTLQAASGPTVTIDQAQLPLPVQGSVSVGGTVAATQSGAWNVGITGTPNVKVTNPAAAPVLSVNVNDPGRTPYQSFKFAACFHGACSATFAAVPAQHRLVMEHITGLVTLSSSTTAIQVALQENFGLDNFVSIFIAPPPISSAGSVTEFDQAIRGYADAGEQPIVTVVANVELLESNNFTLIGYLVDCSVAPCSAIHR
jgi:hypothetical protein